ncbi:hypothetical protein BXY75_3419 [Ulvibacter antarcticus]|uniref:PH (Pleckstrin Homology) domain-containing protein n=1 Tax=Ulvibacter antarcticus TaxID=442714 RepID=A0A3L9YEA0_9FLAO|nr:hypothetical protein BXY75_3419 [Ulvibacter antarcticus]
MTKKRINTNLHYAQYVIARIILFAGIGFLIYSIWIQKIGAIIFLSFFVIYILILMKKVFYKPTEIEFDENYIYIENGNERIEINKIIRIKRNRLIFDLNGVESKLKLPNLRIFDGKWIELKELILNKKH